VVPFWPVLLWVVLPWLAFCWLTPCPNAAAMSAEPTAPAAAACQVSLVTRRRPASRAAIADPARSRRMSRSLPATFRWVPGRRPCGQRHWVPFSRITGALACVRQDSSGARLPFYSGRPPAATCSG